MKIHNCPSCKAPLLTSLQKLKLSPIKKIQCRNCGAYVGVSKLRIFSLLLFSQVTGFLFAVIGFEIGKIGGMAIAAIGALLSLVTAFAFFLWLYGRAVPLEVKRD